MLRTGSDDTVDTMAPRFPSRAAAPAVHGDRVILCALEPRDVAAMLENDRDPETAARFGWDPPDAAAWRCARHVQRAAGMWRTGEQLVFAVRESADGPLVGIVDARMRDRPPGSEGGDPAVELSWTTVPAARGRGVATDAVRALVAYCATIGVDQVWAKVEHDNAASLAVARAAGFTNAARDDRWVLLSAVTREGQRSG
jgi:RimJ/RimL family protein N-acetyltransferase